MPRRQRRESSRATDKGVLILTLPQMQTWPRTICKLNASLLLWAAQVSATRFVLVAWSEMNSRFRLAALKCDMPAAGCLFDQVRRGFSSSLESRAAVSTCLERLVALCPPQQGASSFLLLTVAANTRHSSVKTPLRKHPPGSQVLLWCSAALRSAQMTDMFDGGVANAACESALLS